MKSRVKQWKRNWRKLEKGDRGMFIVYGWYTVFMILASLVSLEFIINAFWSLILLFFTSFYIARRRLNQYLYYLKGSTRQERLDWFKFTQTRFENAELSARLKLLNSDYKKLEYDYNQLKRNINPKSKKK